MLATDRCREVGDKKSYPPDRVRLSPLLLSEVRIPSPLFFCQTMYCLVRIVERSVLKLIYFKGVDLCG